jgi:Fe-S-cluster containining protein
MKLDVISNADATKPWYANGLSFTCTQCGNCCTGGPGYVWISKVEIERLADFLKLSVDETIKQHTRRVSGRVSLKEHRTPAGLYDCNFLKEIDAEREVDGQRVRYKKRICTIYPVRPLQCRTWPFWDGILQSEKSWTLASRGCPGMDIGRVRSVEEIERLRDVKDWPAE